MAQRSSSRHTLPTDLADRVLLFPTRLPAAPPADRLAEEPHAAATGKAVRTRTRSIRQVAVIEVAGPLGEAAQDLDLAIQLALAQGPRGVVCDLSNVLEDADPVAVQVLATSGRHVRDWPGIPVAVACPDHRLRDQLRAHRLGGHLVLTASLFCAVSEVLATPAPAVERLYLAAHPTARRASRDFVTRTLLDWRLGRVISAAGLVAGELVASSSNSAGTDIDLSLAWHLGALRLTARDHGPALAGQGHGGVFPSGRRRAMVAGLTRAFGVLPAADGGKVIWAVLEAPLAVPLVPEGSRAASRRHQGVVGVPLLRRGGHAVIAREIAPVPG